MIRNIKKVATALFVLSTVSISSFAAEPHVVALFGDSTSLGFNEVFAENFPNESFGNGRLNFGQPSQLLSTLLNESRRPSVVANLGVGGTSSGPAVFEGLQGNVNGVDRISEDLATLRDNIDGRGYFALIMYGVNDAAFGIPSSVTNFNNQIMIQRANTEGFTAVVSSILPCDVCSFDVPTLNSDIINGVVRQFNLGADVHFADNHAAVRADWVSLFSDPDGIHPNDTGYAVIARNWFDAQLSQLIEPDSQFVLSPIISLLLEDQ